MVSIKAGSNAFSKYRICFFPIFHVPGGNNTIVSCHFMEDMYSAMPLTGLIIVFSFTWLVNFQPHMTTNVVMLLVMSLIFGNASIFRLNHVIQKGPKARSPTLAVSCLLLDHTYTSVSAIGHHPLIFLTHLYHYLWRSRIVVYQTRGDKIQWRLAKNIFDNLNDCFFKCCLWRVG